MTKFFKNSGFLTAAELITTLSTPILNAPQTAILGMHKIEDRPVVVDGEIVVRPMMYLAMSYDHRMLDGKEAVSFLVSIKEQLENPEKLLLNL